MDTSKLGNGLFVLAAIMLLQSGASESATIVNGSFEQATPGGALPGYGGFKNISTANNEILGWSVTDPNLEWVHTRYYGGGSVATGFDGDYFLDLNGTQPGNITQEITGLVIGGHYQLSFAMSANPNGGNVKTMDVSVGTTSQSYSFDYVAAGATVNDLKWEMRTLDFVASASSETLEFQSTTISTGFWGPQIDAATIQAVPMPAAVWLFLSGLLGLGGVARRRPAQDSINKWE